MSDVISTRAEPLARPREARLAPEPRRLPIGYGLAAGAAVSAGLWAGIIWVVTRIF